MQCLQFILNPFLVGPGEKMGGETHGVGWGQRNYHPGHQIRDAKDRRQIESQPKCFV